MIGHLRGRLLSQDPDRVVVETGAGLVWLLFLLVLLFSGLRGRCDF